MRKTHRVLTATTGGVAALSLMASPAAAAPAAGSVTSFPAHSAVAVSAQRELQLLSVGDYHARLDAQLDRVAAVLLANRAQWDGVASTAVLSAATRSAAVSDLFWAARTSRHLAAVPTTGTYAATAAEQAQIASLRAGLSTLAARLRGLLDNPRPATRQPQARFERIAARTATDRPRVAPRFDLARCGLGADDRRDNRFQPTAWSGHRDGHRSFPRH
ncbi:MAG: hypothetical protein JWN31_1680 [Frankiales bacterium]|nr:hypothetical protein [Frankiales bacterium]